MQNGVSDMTEVWSLVVLVLALSLPRHDGETDIYVRVERGRCQ